MGVTKIGWKNKYGVNDRTCNWGSWKQHWINYSNKTWPSKCSVSGCTNAATLGAEIVNSNVSGEYIVPVCESCNKLISEFNLENESTLVSANKQEACGK